MTIKLLMERTCTLAQILSKLVADEGQFYIGYDDYTESFNSHPIADIEEFLRQVVPALDWQDDSQTEPRLRELVMQSKFQFDVTGQRLGVVKAAIEILRQGSPLPIDFARSLYEFGLTLNAVVPDGDWYTPEIDDWVQGLIREYGLRDRYNQDYELEDILVDCEAIVFSQVCVVAPHPNLHVVPDPSQCRFLGEFLAQFLTVSRLALDNPLDVIKASVIKR